MIDEPDYEVGGDIGVNASGNVVENHPGAALSRRLTGQGFTISKNLKRINTNIALKAVKGKRKIPMR